MGMFEPTRQERLGELAVAVSYAIGAHPQCIAGVAILVELARLYGIELTPRAVGLAGQSSVASLATGTAARKYISSHGGPSEADMTSGEDTGWSADAPFRNSGHMVAIDERSSLLLDPSFEQFARAGFPDTVIATTVDLNTPEWPVPLSESAFVVYLPSADVGGWRDHYEGAREAVIPMAEEISAHLRSGGKASTHDVRLDLDGAILR